eukprot:6228456-Prymnesium_polylepis.1
MIACPSLRPYPWMSPVPWGHVGRPHGRVRARAADGCFEKYLLGVDTCADQGADKRDVGVRRRGAWPKPTGCGLGPRCLLLTPRAAFLG